MIFLARQLRQNWTIYMTEYLRKPERQQSRHREKHKNTHGGVTTERGGETPDQWAGRDARGRHGDQTSGAAIAIRVGWGPFHFAGGEGYCWNYEGIVRMGSNWLGAGEQLKLFWQENCNGKLIFSCDCDRFRGRTRKSICICHNESLWGRRIRH